MGIKEKVKKGELTATEAMALVQTTSATYGWCARRKTGIPVISEQPSDNQAKPKKYKSRKTHLA